MELIASLIGGGKVFSRFTALLTKIKIIMLSWTIIFIVVALVAGLFGFTKIARGAAGIARILFFIFVLLLILSLVTDMFA
ncbi:DUF1328 domain-containing protein [Ekhidna sp.]